jgi:hypothetical protein
VKLVVSHGLGFREPVEEHPGSCPRSEPSGILLTQISKAMLTSHPYYDLYVSDQNMGFWKIVMEGVSVIAS